MEKYKNKYRIESNRRRGWNYANEGAYFITIVTANRECVFGDVVNGEIRYSQLGQIAYDEFMKSFEIRHELQIGAFCLMPNHLHAILILDNDDFVGTHDSVETHGRASLQSQSNGIAYRSPKSISSFVAQYKSSVVSRYDDWVDTVGMGKKYNRQNPLWQSNYHDHIIRDEQEYSKIMEYIINNPLKWNDDCYGNEK
ncbi:MAG: hypothetical protein IJ986_05505 [Bacteroidales bacterium]|nr:hypothetical protein [Bacteroidales bacterium]